MDDPWSSNAWGEDTAASASSSSASPWTSPVVASSIPPTPASTAAAFDDTWTRRATDQSMEETVEEWGAPSSSNEGWSGAEAGLDDLGSPTLEVRTPRLGGGQDVSEGFEDVSFAAPPSHEASLPPFSSSDALPDPDDSPSPVLEPVAPLSLEREPSPPPLDRFADFHAAPPTAETRSNDDDAWGDFGSTTLPPAAGDQHPDALPEWSPEAAKAAPAPVEETAPLGADNHDEVPAWTGVQEEEVARPKGAEDAWASAAEEGSVRRAALRRLDPERLAALLVQTRDWASEAFAMPEADDVTFLPPGQAAMTMNVLGAMTDSDGEIAPVFQTLSSPPIFDPTSSTGLSSSTAGARRTSLLFQNSSVQTLFRSGLDATRLHAAETAARISASAPARLTPHNLRSNGGGHATSTKDGTLWGSPASLATPTSRQLDGAFRDSAAAPSQPAPPTSGPAAWFGWARDRTQTNSVPRNPTASPPPVRPSSAEVAEAQQEGSRMSRFLTRFSRTNPTGPSPGATVDASAASPSVHVRTRTGFSDATGEFFGRYDTDRSPAVGTPGPAAAAAEDDDDKPLSTIARRGSLNRRTEKQDDDLYGLFSPGMPPARVASPTAAPAPFDAFADLDSLSPKAQSPRANGVPAHPTLPPTTARSPDPSLHAAGADAFDEIFNRPPSTTAAPSKPRLVSNAMSRTSSSGSGSAGPARIPTPVMLSSGRTPAVRMSAQSGGGGRPSLPMLAPPSSGARFGSRPSSAGSVEGPSAFGDFGDFATATAKRPSTATSFGSGQDDDLFGSFSAASSPPRPQQSGTRMPTMTASPPRTQPSTAAAAPGAPLSQQDLSFFESL